MHDVLEILQKSDIAASFLWLRLYRRGKRCWRGHVPCQQSSQNDVFLPLPTLFEYTRSFVASMVFQGPFDECKDFTPGCNEKYQILQQWTRRQKAFLPLWNRQIHFAKSNKFLFWRSMIPNPPESLGYLIIGWYLFFAIPPFQRRTLKSFFKRNWNRSFKEREIVYKEVAKAMLGWELNAHLKTSEKNPKSIDVFPPFQQSGFKNSPIDACH